MPTSLKCRLLGDCWICDGTGRVVKHGCSKLVKCGECHGTGRLMPPEFVEAMGENFS